MHPSLPKPSHALTIKELFFSRSRWKSRRAPRCITGRGQLRVYNQASKERAGARTIAVIDKLPIGGGKSCQNRIRRLRVPTFFWGETTLSPKGLTSKGFGTRSEIPYFGTEQLFQN